MPDTAVFDLAGRQCGLFSRSQAFDLGATNEVVHRRLAAGWWLQVAPGVYSLPGWPGSWHRRLWLAHLDVGLHSVVSHEAAALLHGLTPFPAGRVTVTVPHGDHERPAPEYEVRQSTDLRPHHCTTIDGLPVTTPARTLVDLAARTGYARLGRAVDDAHVARRCRIDDVVALYEELRRPGKRGMRTMKAVLAPRCLGYVPSESVLERRLLRVLAQGGLPEPVQQAPLPWRPHEPQRVDFLYPRQRLIIEADGRRYHSRLDQMADDRRRDREAQLHGHDVLRFVWEEITKQPTLVCEAVAAALALADAA